MATTERTFVPAWRRRQQLPHARPAGSAVGGGRSPYRLGRDFERAIRGRLERRGYFVQRQQGSKGPVDLLAVAKGKPVLFVQCKRRGDLSSVEWNTLYDLAERHGAWAVLAMKVSERTVAFMRLDARREFRSREKPMTEFDPDTCAEAPPTLL